MRFFVIILSLVFLSFESKATTLLPVNDQIHVEKSDLAVEGIVTKIKFSKKGSRTYIDLLVTEVLFGPAQVGETIGIRQLGGKKFKVASAAVFKKHDKVVAFLDQDNEGYFHPHSMAASTFNITSQSGIEEIAPQLEVTSLSRRDHRHLKKAYKRALKPFKQKIRQMARAKKKAKRLKRNKRFTPQNLEESDTTETPNNLLGDNDSYRYMGPELSQLNVSMNGPDNLLGEEKSFEVMEAAALTWRNATGGAADLKVKTNRNNGRGWFACTSRGNLEVHYNDPAGEIAGGAIAIGGACASGAAVVVMSDLSNHYSEPSEGVVNIAKAIITHEIGHGLGLAHSCEAYNHPNEEFRCSNRGVASDQATMRWAGHGDNRGATLQQYDKEAICNMYNNDPSCPHENTNDGEGTSDGVGVPGGIGSGGGTGGGTPGEVDYGEVTQGQSLKLSYIYRHFGEKDKAKHAVIAGINPEDYTIGEDICINRDLHPGYSCRIDVTFSPGALGARGALLQVKFSNKKYVTAANLIGYGTDGNGNGGRDDDDTGNDDDNNQGGDDGNNDDDNNQGGDDGDDGDDDGSEPTALYNVDLSKIFIKSMNGGDKYELRALITDQNGNPAGKKVKAWFIIEQLDGDFHKVKKRTAKNFDKLNLQGAAIMKRKFKPGNYKVIVVTTPPKLHYSKGVTGRSVDLYIEVK